MDQKKLEGDLMLEMWENMRAEFSYKNIQITVSKSWSGNYEFRAEDEKGKQLFPPVEEFSYETLADLIADLVATLEDWQPPKELSVDEAAQMFIRDGNLGHHSVLCSCGERLEKNIWSRNKFVKFLSFRCESCGWTKQLSDESGLRTWEKQQQPPPKRDRNDKHHHFYP